ncbi:tyrosine-type recombinase/integrase [Aeromicrobium terrae]|jgi:integrase|uniref:Recombinase XerD n=1 Tax=Aeromicrobium terrae TaxID=2498846 RepID=A0A5C8NM50_9ACTN|nr:tyrosine-type recombinase/integrase [Aeromicrobium terrae]TXL62147.1 recombinase XerD [Aeromicrobium terrae]
MTVRKTPGGRWRGVVKSGRQQVASKTFDTRKQAIGWVARERAAMAGGVDPRAGRRTVRTLLPEWLEERQHAVSRKTFVSDSSLPRLVPPALAALQIGVVTDREVTRALIALNQSGLAESSVRRFRASLSSFFAWAVRERMIASNPVMTTRVPKGRGTRTEIRPFAEDELESFYMAVSARDQRLADILLIASWTGLRWSELRELRVRDFVQIPMPVLLVSRAAPEGVNAKLTKSGKSRRVPVADRVLPLVLSCAADKGADDLLLTTRSGHRLHASSVKRAVVWSNVAPGRRIHDLRHTAACLWLARGVDPVTVQAWLGHASIATTNIYLHHLGSSADRTGLDRLNRSGGAGGAHQAGLGE